MKKARIGAAPGLLFLGAAWRRSAMGTLGSALFFAPWISIAAALAQEPPVRPDSEMPEILRGQGGPIWPLEWRIDESGELLWRSAAPQPEALREWRDVDFSGGLANVGLWGWINALACGPRDLASLADAEGYFSRHMPGLGSGELRELIVTPVTETERVPARRAALERILAVRLVQERGITEANGELRAISSDARADPFLRAAARDALDAGGAAPVPVPDSALLTLPQDADLLLYVDQTRVPPAFSLPRAGAVLARQIMHVVLRDEEHPPEHLADAQMHLDLNPVLPFEFALRYGNARVDWLLGALRTSPEALSLEARGRFETDALLRSPASADLDSQGGILRGERIGRLDLNVELEEDRLHVATWDFERAPRESAADLREAGIGEAPIWFHLPAHSAILQYLPVQAVDATLEIELAGQVAMVLRSRHASEQHARATAALLSGALRQAEQALQAMEPGPDLDKVLGVLGSVGPRVDGSTCVVEVEMRGIALDDVVTFLGRFELR